MSKSISVVIPTYNRSHCVMNAVNSVLSQTVLPDEILVIDDGSTDGTENLFDDVPNIVRYIKKENQGVSAARNRGIYESRGEWIAFLDSDDTWLPEKLEKQLNCIDKTHADACFTGNNSDDGRRYDEINLMDSELQIGMYRCYTKPVHFITCAEKHPLIQSLLVKKAVLISLGGFDEKLYVAEDTALFYRLVAHYNVALINEALLVLTRAREVSGLSDSASVEKALKRYDSYFIVQVLAYQLMFSSPSIDRQTSIALLEIRRRLSYFLSRRAEIALALDDRSASICFAKEGFVLAKNVKTKIRCLLLAYFHPVIKNKIKKKWLDGGEV